MKKVLFASALALLLAACSSQTAFRSSGNSGAVATADPFTAGPAEQNNASCFETGRGGAACINTHEQGDSKGDHGGGAGDH